MGELPMSNTMSTLRDFRIARIEINRLIFTALLLVICATTVLPLLWMLSTSLKFEEDVFNFPIQWIPERFNAAANYSEVWGGQHKFYIYYLNSIKVSVATTILQVTFSTMAAYAFAKLRFKLNKPIFLLFLAAIMIPPQVIIIPRFIIIRGLGLYNTHFGLIVMMSFSVFGMFLLKQYMTTIPDSLLESAKIDGASHRQIFTRIIVPTSKPAIATLAILKFVWTWNDFQNPLIFLRDQERFTIQMGMKLFQDEYGTFYALTMTAAVSAIIPMFIIFIIGQKYIIKGIVGGAVKG